MSLCIVIRLGCWSMADRRDRSRCRHWWMLVCHMSVHERLERTQLCELACEHLWVSTKVMHHDLRRLLILCEVSTLEKASRPRRVHEEIRRPVELYNQATRLAHFCISMLEENVFDECKGVFDFVSGLVVVDIIGHACFVGRVEDDEVHGVLAHTRPLANTEGAASQVVDH